MQGGHYFCAHSYFADNDNPDDMCETTAPWYVGRPFKFDDYFMAHNLYLYWWAGEGGACRGEYDASGRLYLNAGLGWKASRNINSYAQKLLWCNEYYRQESENRQRRIMGFSVFTSFGGQEWQSFYLNGQDLVTVTDVLVAL
jgi:hypothetical protein